MREQARECERHVRVCRERCHLGDQPLRELGHHRRARRQQLDLPTTQVCSSMHMHAVGFGTRECAEASLLPDPADGGSDLLGHCKRLGEL